MVYAVSLEAKKHKKFSMVKTKENPEKLRPLNAIPRTHISLCVPHMFYKAPSYARDLYMTPFPIEKHRKRSLRNWY